MTRFAIALAAVLACSSVLAGELKHRATYSAESLQQQGITTVDALVEDYAAQQHLALAPMTPPLFLVNGIKNQLSAEAMDEAVSKATVVEVMSDGDTVVVNVLLKS